jgi:hypothetical protein
MDRVPCMACAVVVLVLASAFAGPGIAATKADLEREVQRFSVACAKNEIYPDLYDCRCLTEGYRKGVQAADSTHQRKEIVRDLKLLESCPASKASIFGWFKRDCASTFRRQADHGEICECGAERFSTSFRSAPPASRREIDLLKKSSLQACGLPGK